MSARPLRHARQRGVAVVTALLLTTLAVTIVASLFWQQQVQVRSMENQRLHLQTRWVLRGALDWARLILQQEGRDSRDITREDGVWATPLAETRLDQYLERERQNNESYDATLSGQIFDAQARYNLANLASANGTVDPVQLAVFQRLLRNLQLSDSMAQGVADAVKRAYQATPPPVAPQGATGTETVIGTPGTADGTKGVGTPVRGTTGTGAGSGSATPLAMIRAEDLLAVAGVTQQAVERLREFVIVLPVGTQVNPNTAKAEVLAALFETMSVSEAQSLVVQRKRSPWSQANGLKSAGGIGPVAPVAYRSDNFLVQSQVRLERAALETWSLIRRDPHDQGSRTAPVWIREL
ncbi:type II secretion system minor pseudopilin GspK [Pseudoduganella chitinolytica]|uniref:Type II secretion system protein K n=1 Tax=Pseudoduganella chitinolytica TaxID=34070 RepID=A0ABY8B8W2_9BURK|nr:type II secretion system minor pseudopilin GspK [Pseudoduganella chitinolytica]WEF32369.1 type II secretion system minor pseudopilin GspK [Pseudoduganella chitinolytica]